MYAVVVKIIAQIIALEGLNSQTAWQELNVHSLKLQDYPEFRFQKDTLLNTKLESTKSEV
jgi:hypothetical protein